MASIPVTVVNGQASEDLELPSLPAGNYTITESYQDINGGFSGSSKSGPLTVKAATAAPSMGITKDTLTSELFFAKMSSPNG